MPVKSNRFGWARSSWARFSSFPADAHSSTKPEAPTIPLWSLKLSGLSKNRLIRSSKSAGVNGKSDIVEDSTGSIDTISIALLWQVKQYIVLSVHDVCNRRWTSQSTPTYISTFVISPGEISNSLDLVGNWCYLTITGEPPQHIRSWGWTETASQPEAAIPCTI